MIKTLAPIHDRTSYYEPALADMVQQLWDMVFKPIFDILGTKVPARINSLADLHNALRAGRIFWHEGYFYGEFNSKVAVALRGLGATFNSVKKAYRLGLDRLPADIRVDISIGKGMNRTKTERILQSLEDSEKMKLTIGAGNVAMVQDLNAQFAKTIKVLPESLQIPMDLNEQQKENLQESYHENLELYINGWKQEQIERLREKTEKNAALGYRADRLQAIVKSEFGMSQRRAKLIARQETSLFVSKYRQERYTSAGVKSYIWSTSHDERVRPDHAALNHQVFTWDNPPVVDRATGRRGNPGEDFGCRCLALPVIRLGVS